MGFVHFTVDDHILSDWPEIPEIQEYARLGDESRRCRMKEFGFFAGWRATTVIPVSALARTARISNLTMKAPCGSTLAITRFMRWCRQYLLFCTAKCIGWILFASIV